MQSKKRGAMGRLRFSELARRLAMWTGHVPDGVPHPEHAEPRHRGDAELERYREHYAALARVALKKLRAGELDTDSPEIKVYAEK
jgi:hypothetical protein